MDLKENVKELVVSVPEWPAQADVAYFLEDVTEAAKSLLSRKERLKYSGLFQQAYQQGKTLYSKHLRLNFTLTRETYKDALPFVGFSISKDFSKSAVKRNRLRRQLREIYRLFRLIPENANQLKALGLIVISPQKSISEKNSQLMTYSNLREELHSLLSKSLTTTSIR